LLFSNAESLGQWLAAEVGGV